MPEPKEQCNCKEMTCPANCRERHTHKGFFCEVCKPKENSWEERFDKAYIPSQTFAERKEWNREFVRSERAEAKREAVEELIQKFEVKKVALEKTCENYEMTDLEAGSIGMLDYVLTHLSSLSNPPKA